MEKNRKIYITKQCDYNIKSAVIHDWIFPLPLLEILQSNREMVEGDMKILYSTILGDEKQLETPGPE